VGDKDHCEVTSSWDPASYQCRKCNTIPKCTDKCL